MSAKRLILWVALPALSLVGTGVARAQALVANAASTGDASLDGWFTLGASVLAVLMLAWRLGRSNR